METAVTAQGRNCVLVAGDPTVFSPPFPLLSTSLLQLLSYNFCRAARRCRSPTQLHGPEHVRQAGCPDLELRQGLHFPGALLLAVLTAVLHTLFRTLLGAERAHHLSPGPA